MRLVNHRATSPSGGASASEPGGDGVWGRSPQDIKAKALQES
jgi:hypothetical protein